MTNPAAPLDLYNYDLEEEQTRQGARRHCQLSSVCRTPASLSTGPAARMALSIPAVMPASAMALWSWTRCGSKSIAWPSIIRFSTRRTAYNATGSMTPACTASTGMRWAAKYRKFIPHCGNRSDLNYLITEMIGELNIGHTYVWGGDVGIRCQAGLDWSARCGFRS